MINYIQSIRSLVGHAPVMFVGASVIAENNKGEILLQRRKDNGLWGYAGGCVEVGEFVEDAAKRELFEETGLEADALDLLGVFSGPELHYFYPNGDEASVVDIVFICRRWHGSLKADPGEVLDLKFFPPDALPEAISPPNRPALRAYLEKVVHTASYMK